ncbi:flagellar biosynthesis anti-sigma factor FlgM [Azovibrio restrictus]|uniref:flagellar biosynthesis anti-sigma factor FlgM n=1 Tax=Azovibrio restrictus TaxID=146938 RepID=UPI00047C1363|nr:flagellar biosynthesis anti-sigma factor FlgM [Azovibrio restrictus]MCE1171854.1 flagellar biosynthesis anti-sigma factor FlgM [Azovibrio sp.]
MKVDTALKVAPTPPSRTAAKPAGTAAAGEQVKLSDAAQLKGSEPPVNNSRVQEIKQAIAEGRFRVNPEAIAERLITTAQELINAQRKA